MNNVISNGKNVYNYVARNLKSARRQIAYYTVPVDVRAGTNHKFKKSSFKFDEINKRADQYEHYLLKDKKLVKTVDKINKQFTEVNKAINDLPAVKSTKKICKKVVNLLKKYFANEEPSLWLRRDISSNF